MGLNRLLVVLCTVLLVSCSGSLSAPTDVPDIRGSWRGVPYSWNWTDNYSLDPGSKGAANCAGAIVITSQDGSSFGGRYVIDNCGAEGSSGAVLDGHARRDAWWWSLTSRACGSRGQNRVTLDAAEGMPLSSPEA